MDNSANRKKMNGVCDMKYIFTNTRRSIRCTTADRVEYVKGGLPIVCVYLNCLNLCTEDHILDHILDHI